MADPYAVAKEMYPILKDYKYKIVNTPDKNSPYSLEHFPPGEKGSATMPRPKDISINEYGLQIFKDVRPEDIAGDIISHHLVNEDKYLSKEYQKFKNSVSSETMMSRYEYHKNNLGEERDFNSWSERTGYPELFRGYVFNQFNKKEIDNIYNSKQKEILKNIKNYVTKKGMAKGGIAMNKQTEMAFTQQGGLKDDGMKQDPISGNPIPNGSMAEEVRDDIPAQLSEGEYVVPADVVRYYGVKHFEDIRNNAKQGLQSMEANGRIGGEPVPVGGPKAGMQQQMASDLSQDEMQEIQSMMMAVGGFVEQPTNMQQQSDPYLQQQTMYQQPMAMSRGGLGFTPTTSSNLSPTVVSGSFSKSPAQQAAEAAANATAKAAEVAKNKVTLYGLKGEEVSVVFPSEEYNKYIAQGYTTAKPVTPKDDDPRNPSNTTGGGSTGSGSAGFEDWGKDWSDWSDPNAYADKISAGVIGTKGLKTGAGIATALGGPGLAVAIGVGGKIALGQAISDLRAASIMAKAQGLPTKYIDDKAAKLVEQGGGIFQLADFLGLASGKIKAGNNLTRLGMLSEEDDDGDFKFSPSQIKHNQGIKPTTTPTPKEDDDGRPPTFTDVTGSGRTQAEIDAGAGSGSYNTSPTGKVSTAKPTVVSDKGQSTSDDFATGDPGMGGVFSNKGGLMRKKKTKGK